MSKFIVIPFETETAAYEGVRALRALDVSGDISIYSYSVIGKAEDGALSIKRSEDGGPRGMAAGALAGGLIGLIGGPLGFAFGATTGALFGGIADLLNSGAPVDFARKVVETLKPGEIALIAEIEEEWETPLDTRLAALGTAADRTWRADLEDAQIEAEIAATRDTIAHLKAEIAAAGEERRAALSAKLEKAQSQLEAARDRANDKIAAIRADADVRSRHLDEQIKTASEANQARLTKRMDDLREAAEKRAMKLDRLWQDTKDLFRG